SVSRVAVSCRSVFIAGAGNPIILDAPVLNFSLSLSLSLCLSLSLSLSLLLSLGFAPFLLVHVRLVLCVVSCVFCLGVARLAALAVFSLKTALWHCTSCQVGPDFTLTMRARSLASFFVFSSFCLCDPLF